jgi:hypothetical protein
MLGIEMIAKLKEIFLLFRNFPGKYDKAYRNKKSNLSWVPVAHTCNPS